MSEDSCGGEFSITIGRALGTDTVLALPIGAPLEIAKEILRRELEGIDRAVSRFRSDAELASVERAAGRPVRVSERCFTALEVALSVAERTGGAVDPTVGNALVALGYDRDFSMLDAGSGSPQDDAPAMGWWSVELDTERRTVRVPPGVHLDLGASAKALCADRAAAAIACAIGAGALVCLGGDVAVSGAAPHAGWPIGIGPSSGVCRNLRCVVAVRDGGLATSSPVIREWRKGDRAVSHIVDPGTGSPAPRVWRLVSVAAGSCVDANAASTAAVVWGEEAPGRLARLGVSARLESFEGSVTSVGGWPPDAHAKEADT